MQEKRLFLKRFCAADGCGEGLKTQAGQRFQPIKSSLLSSLPSSLLKRSKRQKESGAGAVSSNVGRWRRRWDSNPRGLSPYLISSQGRYDHFDTPPRLDYHSAIGGFCQGERAGSARPEGLDDHPVFALIRSCAMKKGTEAALLQHADGGGVFRQADAVHG